MKLEQALNYFQSTYHLTLSYCNLTYEELNKKFYFKVQIYIQYYELIVYLRNLQNVSYKPFIHLEKINVTNLLYMNTNDLYLSKIKVLELFWCNYYK
jgi:hypothetical protein